MKLLLVGFDGVSWDLGGEDWLPGFRIVQGRSPHPAYTGPCWTTIYTGWNPDRHGVTHAWGLALDGSNTIGRCIQFWRMLMDAGISTGIINLPCAGDPLIAYRGADLSETGLPGDFIVDLCCIAPTILALFGLDWPVNWPKDGDILPGMLLAGGDDLKETPDPAQTSRLQALGYLDT